MNCQSAGATRRIAREHRAHQRARQQEAAAIALEHQPGHALVLVGREQPVVAGLDERQSGLSGKTRSTWTEWKGSSSIIGGQVRHHYSMRWGCARGRALATLAALALAAVAAARPQAPPARPLPEPGTSSRRPARGSPATT